MSRAIVRLALLTSAVLLLLWGLLVAASGGVRIHLLFVGISSRNPLRPLLAGLALGVVYLTKYRDEWQSDLRGFTRAVPWPQAIAAVAVVATFLIGVEQSGFFGGGPDSSGYVSQADKWARGDLITPIPDWAQEAPWENALTSAAPVGYTADSTNKYLVPVYSPGLPLVMSLFQRIGGREAIFYVVPLFGAVAMWSTYLLARYLGNEWSGAISVTLFLFSPAFLWMLVEPMSDVPVTACWALALVFACRGQKPSDAFFAGIASGVAILIRPNVAPLAIFPAALLLLSPALRPSNIINFLLGTIPAVLLIATINAQWYGSPLKSGYGSLAMLYSASRIPVNLERYLSWIVETQTAMVFVWVVLPFVTNAFDLRRRIVLIWAFPIAVLGLYLPYFTFDEWAYLRFLLPAYPIVLAAVASLFVAFVRDMRPRRVAVAAVAAVTLSLLIQQSMFAADVGVFQKVQGQRRYMRAVELVNTVPPNAIIVSDAYSGTLRFYTGRDVLRWPAILPSQLDSALAYLSERGHPIYFVGDRFEADKFKELFSKTTAAMRFDAGTEVDTDDGFVMSNLTPR